MRLEPLRDWLVGFALVTKMPGKVQAYDPSKGVTRCYLIENVGPEAEAAGHKPGDIVVAKHAFDEFFMGGTYHRVTFSVNEIIQRVHDVSLDDFLDVHGNPFKVPANLAPAAQAQAEN